MEIYGAVTPLDWRAINEGYKYLWYGVKFLGRAIAWAYMFCVGMVVTGMKLTRSMVGYVLRRLFAFGRFLGMTFMEWRTRYVFWVMMCSFEHEQLVAMRKDHQALHEYDLPHAWGSSRRRIQRSHVLKEDLA